MSATGIVVIGRNEGERLVRCLDSVVGRGHPVVYVDSGSTDGSAAEARSRGAEVVELTATAPFTAARARNAGAARLIQVAPSVRYVQFVDGDCEVVEGWADLARRELEARAGAAVVCGRLRERFPERSVYNRLADLEWDAPAGPVDNSGGIAMMRVDAFQAVGGFDPGVPAGEEPELCQRLRDAGWSVVRVADEMAWHDSALLTFRSWWRRAVRGGYGGSDVARRFGRGRGGLFRGQIRSARVWALGWPASVLAGGAAVAVVVGPTAGAAAAGLVAAALPAQAARLGWRVRKRVGSRAALAHGALAMAAKWAHLAGQVSYLMDRAAGRRARLIEHKSAANRAAKAAPSP